ncbi:biliverdin-producing heme oxygenase [Kutzneria viridogrisea]|uniref:Heme oxygenase n=2 Tax=Kutzneria TaxID=43356 RepID=W5WK69_9PSEU|nr:biliverdin-producing heme oxygenase [Kutzneria albida]AHI01126.1 hypothetical protein KALB_7768 [Kutzneria albida DSM 43870]MBA8926381.1 heme oxygenase [Kutzneria viridogrisea]
MGEQFSTVLRTGTAQEHENAENAGFIKAIFDGRLSLDGFATLVAQHYFIYQVLEQAAEAMAADPVAGAFVLPELTRLPSLESDLGHLYGPGWRDRVEPTPATLRYLDRLREVCFTWAGGFVAHHYTRYLGDISGGQAVRAVVERHHGLVDHRGTSFYVFDGIPSRPGFRTRYRELLDSTGWDAAEQARVVEEACLAFRLNAAVFADLGALVP